MPLSLRMSPASQNDGLQVALLSQPFHCRPLDAVRGAFFQSSTQVSVGLEAFSRQGPSPAFALQNAAAAPSFSWTRHLSTASLALERSFSLRADLGLYRGGTTPRNPSRAIPYFTPPPACS